MYSEIRKVENEKPIDYVTTTRLEEQTQLSLMAALIYGSVKMTVERAIDIALDIKTGVEVQLRSGRGITKVENKNERVQTNRLDLKTRICLMSSFIYASIDGIGIDDAIEEAVKIENASDARVKRMKKENPVFPEDKVEEKKEFTRPRATIKEKKQPVQ